MYPYDITRRSVLSKRLFAHTWLSKINTLKLFQQNFSLKNVMRGLRLHRLGKEKVIRCAREVYTTLSQRLLKNNII